MSLYYIYPNLSFIINCTLINKHFTFYQTLYTMVPKNVIQLTPNKQFIPNTLCLPPQSWSTYAQQPWPIPPLHPMINHPHPHFPFPPPPLYPTNRSDNPVTPPNTVFPTKPIHPKSFATNLCTVKYFSKRTWSYLIPFNRQYIYKIYQIKNFPAVNNKTLLECN